MSNKVVCVLDASGRDINLWIAKGDKHVAHVASKHHTTALHGYVMRQNDPHQQVHSAQSVNQEPENGASM